MGPVIEMHSSASPSRRKLRRGCSSVNWRSVGKHQTYGALVVLLVAAIVTGVSHFFKEPAVRPLPAYDPTISLPSAPKDTVPMTEAAALPFVALIITIVLVEFCVMRGKQSATASVQAAIHVFFMAVVGFGVVLAVTEATKPIASRFRPDFLARCKGADSQIGAADVGKRLDIYKDCLTNNKAVIEDGRKSFPSGHSSNTLSTCWFCILYLTHALYFRGGYSYMGGLWRRGARSFWWRALLELLQGLLMVWGFTVLCIAWWIGVSRYTDHRHNIDDILGGFVAALLWMTPVSLITIGQLTFYHAKIAEEEEAEYAAADYIAEEKQGLSVELPESTPLQQQQQQHDLESQLVPPAAASAGAANGGYGSAATAAAGPPRVVVPAPAAVVAAAPAELDRPTLDSLQSMKK